MPCPQASATNQPQRCQSRGLATTTARFTLRVVFVPRFVVRVTVRLSSIENGWSCGENEPVSSTGTARGASINGNRAPRYFGSVDRWASRLQLPAESIVIPVLAMV